MNKHTFAFLAIAALALCNASPSLSAPASMPAPAATPSVFDDPSIHFVVPAGFSRIPAPMPEIGDHLTPVAGYTKNFSQNDLELITVSLMSYQGGGADGWESLAEQELRNQINGALIKSTKAPLKNGMPAYWLKVQYGEGFDAMEQFGYAIFDGRRGIYVAIGGHVSSIDENRAKEALNDLAVVVYPRGR
ncbi:MAG: hypothetical protein ABR584_02160 [Candidatus Baltobacteraceae bacterium]